MNAPTIDLLASLDPASSDGAMISSTAAQAQDKFSPLHTRARDQFLSKYIRMNFGYYISSQFANRGLGFPMVMLGRDQWVFRAYLMKLDPWKNYDRNIAEAYHIAQFVQDSPYLGQYLKSLLLAFDGKVTTQNHIAHVSAYTGVDYSTIDAFEALFFNVIDRRADGVYMAQAIYPDTRMVEFDENYLSNSSHSDLIKRVAYNHQDMDLTAYLAGIGDHTFLRRLSASDDREAELTRFIMGNGLILTHTNLMNQKSVGMGRVSSLLAASRQSGSDVEEPPIGGIAPLFSQALRKAIDSNQDGMLEQLHKDEGTTIDI